MRALRSLFVIGAIGLGLTACGTSDNGGAIATESSSTMTTMTTGSSGATDQMTTNPCGMHGDGMMPGMDAPMKPASGATAITITASEYKFTGADALKAGGMFAISFKNSGTELHELHIAKLPASEKRTMAELIMDDKARAELTTAGHAFACPGKTADAVGADLSAKGRYIVVCFLPTGLKPETDPKDFAKLGKPHAMNGMAVEIDVA
ncbi:MAG: hypothetical protein QOI47_604 [Actinomycetota bacterium]|nr:hypothetical protein [Actinomycetota bacterium]